MKWFIVSAIVSALTVSGNGPAFAEEALWEPSDFTGAYVAVYDRAENGCWTNIGEAKAYATDQLELAGFKIIEPPTKDTVQPSTTVSNHLNLVIDVKASRWNNGVCIGDLSVYFVGRVVLLDDPKHWVRSAIGLPVSIPIWDKKNFNTIILDQVKSFIALWIEQGKLSPATTHE